MRSSRLLTLSLIVGASVTGIPAPAMASARVPAAVERAVALGPGAALRPTRTRGVFLERRLPSLPVRANLVAVSFHSAAGDPEDLIVEARFRTSKGWSAWERLDVEPDEGPDADEARRGSSRVFAGPVWVGTADAMRLRVVSRPGGPAAWDLRTHLINTLGDSKKPNLLSRVGGAASRLLGGSPAEAMTSTPSVITRRQWGADESWRTCCPRYAPAVHMAFVHHTAGTNSYSSSQSAAIVRGIYRYHTKTRGWSDIGYNFLVDRYGRVFEGRYGGTTRPVIGAHVKGFNSGSTGVSLMGTFSTVYPPSAMQSALKRLLAWKLDVHHVPPVGKVLMTSGGGDKYPAGTRVWFNRISGHRDGQATSCPGSKTYALLPAIRTGVNAIGLPKLYLPSITSTVLRPDGDGRNDAVTVRGSFSGTVNWSVTIQDLAGTTLRRLTGRGSILSATWDGRTVGGLYPHSGVVRYTIEATDDAGRRVRPATSGLYLVTDHPNGTVLAAASGTALIEAGLARPVPTTAVRDSWFRPGEAVASTATAIGRYPPGLSLAIREGTLLQTPDGAYSIFSGALRRPFASPEIFTALGYSPGAALPISAEEADALPPGTAVEDASVHPAGSVVAGPDGTTWTIGEGVRLRHPSVVVRRSWYRDVEVVPATEGDLALPEGTPLTYRQGTLFRLPDGTFWIFSDGARRRFYNPTLFSVMGYAVVNAFSLSSAEAETVPSGPVIG